VFNEETIAKLVANCPVNQFEIEGIDVKDDGRLSDYIDAVEKIVMDDLSSFGPQIVRSKVSSELQLLESIPEIRNHALFVDFSSAVFNYGISTHPHDDQPYLSFSRLMHNVIAVSRGLANAMFSEDVPGALALLRQLYETYIVIVFLCLHPELAAAYSDHRWVSQYHLASAFDIKMDDSVYVKQYERVTREYDPVFLTDYGWAAPAFTKKSRPVLLDLVKDVKLEHFSSIYRLGSDAIHSSSYFVADQPGQDPFLRLTCAAAIEMLTTALSDYVTAMKYTQKERVVTMSLAFAMKTDLETGL